MLEVTNPRIVAFATSEAKAWVRHAAFVKRYPKHTFDIRHAGRRWEIICTDLAEVELHMTLPDDPYHGMRFGVGSGR